MPTTAEEQLALELINRARADPLGEYDELITSSGNGVASNITSANNYFGVDVASFEAQLAGYPSVNPLAWNENLAQSATTHTELMIEEDTQSHNLPGEPGLLQRFQDAGYQNIQTISESIYAYSDDLLYAHAGFYIDWGYDDTDFVNGTRISNWQTNGDGIQDPAGHRDAMLKAAFTEVGVSWMAETDPNTSVGPYLTTHHYGNRFTYEAQVLGVVIDDVDNDDFYDIGEGEGGVSVRAIGMEGTYTTTSWSSGGYQMVVPDGIYTLVFEGGGLSGVYSTMVTMSGDNVKIDAEFADALLDGIDLFGDTVANAFVGTAFADYMRGDDGDDILSGEAGADDLRGNDGEDILDGAGGNDELRGGRGFDTITGGDGDDLLRGNDQGDSLNGGDGEDIVNGDNGADRMYGGADNDSMSGGSGKDSMFGGTGADEMNGGRGIDSMYGGDGNDIMLGDIHDDFLDGGIGDDQMFGGTGRDELIGGVGDDTLSGDGGFDTLYGGDNADVLFGGGGDDIIDGGAAADEIEGGHGDDILTGGTGGDTFIFDVKSFADTITDFGGQDMLQLTAALAGGQTASQIAAAAQLKNGGLFLNFGDGDKITLEAFTDSTALAGMIDIV